MKTRSFFPPATCSSCGSRPVLGETLFHAGEVWLCAACLTAELPGNDIMSKMAVHALKADHNKAESKRAKASGMIEEAVALGRKGQWHGSAVANVRIRGNRIAAEASIVHGEAATSEMKDTLADPDIAAIESSEARGRLLNMNDVIALGIDVSRTVGASNTAEKLVAHEIAVAHKVAMEQASKANWERDPEMAVKRLNVAARMMAAAQSGLLTLQKLRTSGPQNVTVQHVHVNSGGQAVVGNVQNSSGAMSGK
jgi:hypothetical protein